MVKHRETGTRLFGIWRGMIGRCNQPNNTIFRYYGAKGIRVCEEWSEYIPFRDWALSHGYSEDLSLDRIDVNGDYEPGNCRWATKKEQANNTTANVYVEYCGERKTLAEWADYAGLKYHTFYCRLRRGWPFEKALTEGLAHERHS